MATESERKPVQSSEVRPVDRSAGSVKRRPTKDISPTGTIM
jgi:hypothetical protein